LVYFPKNFVPGSLLIVHCGGLRCLFDVLVIVIVVVILVLVLFIFVLFSYVGLWRK